MFGSMTSWMFFLNSIICFTLSIPIHMISLLPRREFLCHVRASQNYQSLCFWSSELKIKIKHQLEAKREPRPEKAQGPTFSSRWCCDSCPAQAKSVFVFLDFLYSFFCINSFVYVSNLRGSCDPWLAALNWVPYYVTALLSSPLSLLGRSKNIIFQSHSSLRSNLKILSSEVKCSMDHSFFT